MSDHRASLKLKSAFDRHIHHYGCKFLNRFGVWPKLTALQKRRSRYWLNVAHKWNDGGRLKPQVWKRCKPCCPADE